MTLQERVREILRINDGGTCTVPSARLYLHRWAWDSAFAATGWAPFNPYTGGA
ncbi:MAG: hypothetical protein ACYCW6_18690 [Candidatus Xenobia bacterium]